MFSLDRLRHEGVDARIGGIDCFTTVDVIDHLQSRRVAAEFLFGFVHDDKTIGLSRDEPAIHDE